MPFFGKENGQSRVGEYRFVTVASTPVNVLQYCSHVGAVNMALVTYVMIIITV
jgi:hypothetical protein